MSNWWKQIHDMSEPELEAFAALHQVGMEGEFENLSAAADHVCAELKITAPDDFSNDPGAELDRIACDYQRKHNCTYEKALGVAGEKRPDLVAKAFPERRVA